MSEYEANFPKREFFAAMMLQGLCACDSENITTEPARIQAAARKAVALADALLFQLAKENNNG